jgi:hypothetical protein
VSIGAILVTGRRGADPPLPGDRSELGTATHWSGVRAAAGLPRGGARRRGGDRGPYLLSHCDSAPAEVGSPVPVSRRSTGFTDTRIRRRSELARSPDPAVPGGHGGATDSAPIPTCSSSVSVPCWASNPGIAPGTQRRRGPAEAAPSTYPGDRRRSVGHQDSWVAREGAERRPRERDGVDAHGATPCAEHAGGVAAAQDAPGHNAEGVGSTWGIN